MGRLALALLLAAVIAAPADARMHAPYRGHRIVPANAAPLDAFTQPSGAYSFRKLKSTYAGPAVRIRRASDNLETDINFLGCTGFTGCPWDEAAAAAHCAATTCFIKTWYDQSGNSRHPTQATAGLQPQLIFNCNGSLPCARSTAGSTQKLAFVPYTSSAIQTMNAVAKTTVRGSTACYYLWSGSNNVIQPHATLDTVFLSNGVNTVSVAATVTAWHSYTGVMNGASSLLRADDIEGTPGLAAASTSASNITLVAGGTGATCDVHENVVWDAYVLTPAERTALQVNQRGFWGTP